MTTAKNRVPAVDGWFRVDGPFPVLLGSRCDGCKTVYFPAENYFCKNPVCQSNHFEEIELSRTGRIWSYTDARYQPPSPYVAKDPYEPFCLAAIELAEEQIVVMGQIDSGVSVSELAVGDQVELIVDVLYEDDENQYLVWKWKPISSPSSLPSATTSLNSGGGGG
ncbi:MAG TPA: OB-fold domain-containing protein [Acidimicrobiales bacterium]|nr:OB-fold domain-containing protein [Acidimicrobiales bacterium]